MTDVDIAQVSTRDDALAWYQQEMLRINLESLETELKTPVDSRSKKRIAELYFKVCADSTVYYYCTHAADHYADLVDADSEDWESRAYLGSAYALKARDYPIQGLWQVFPGPGFVRLYYVNRSASHLNAAVNAQPTNPIIRLIRSSTFISLPGKSAVGRDDMKLLLSWLAEPESNAEYADLLRWPSYINDVYLEYVTEHGPDGGMVDDREALPYLQVIAQSEDTGHPVRRLAELYLEQ